VCVWGGGGIVSSGKRRPHGDKKPLLLFISNLEHRAMKTCSGVEKQ